MRYFKDAVRFIGITTFIIEWQREFGKHPEIGYATSTFLSFFFLKSLVKQVLWR